MNLTIVTPPPFEPVLLSEVYQHLRLAPDSDSSPAEETHPDDALLTGNIQTAREQVEEMARQSLVQRTVQVLGLSAARGPASVASR